jgi:hypothetical protein
MRARAVIWVTLTALLLVVGAANATVTWDQCYGDAPIQWSSSPALGTTSDCTWTVTSIGTTTQWDDYFGLVRGTITGVDYQAFAVFDELSGKLSGATADSDLGWGATVGDGGWTATQGKDILAWKRGAREAYGHGGESFSVETTSTLRPEVEHVALHVRWSGAFSLMGDDGTRGQTAWFTNDRTDRKAPEPASLVLLGCAAGASVWVRRRNRSRS